MPEAASRLDTLVEKLRRHGGRLTPQRLAILKALLAADHPTVEQVFEVVKRDFPMTSLVTVYRTMTTLREAGEVLEVDAGNLVAHYDGLRPHQHPHLVCTGCGRVADAPELDVRGLAADLGQRAGAWALGEEVHFLGLCPDCQSKAARQADERAPSKPG